LQFSVATTGYQEIVVNFCITQVILQLPFVSAYDFISTPQEPFELQLQFFISLKINKKTKRQRIVQQFNKCFYAKNVAEIF
jgi:hypothetical protein